MKPQSSYTPQRIAVVGMSGAGKTTLVNLLAKLLHYPVIQKDALTWDSGWAPVPKAVFTQRLQAELDGKPYWIFDGNYGASSDLIWRQADTVIWLDYPFAPTFRHLTNRTIWRVKHQVELWNGNTETWQLACSSKSIFLYALKSYRKCRDLYPALLAQREFAHLNLIRLESPHETEEWFKQFVYLRQFHRSPEMTERLFDRA